MLTMKLFTVANKLLWPWDVGCVCVCVWVCFTSCVPLTPSLGGTPQLRASASTTVFVNLLDLNDNDPTFLNLPFVAEVPEGLSTGSSVFRVKLENIFTYDRILRFFFLLFSFSNLNAVQILWTVIARTCPLSTIIIIHYKNLQVDLT